MRAAKDFAWAILAGLLSRGLRLLRREPVPFGAGHWRSLAFSFSQLGEDRVLLHLFREMGIERGFYVDVGAFDPVLYSNTLLLHNAGWRGMNIDASAAAVRLFERHRPADINVHAAISDGERRVAYFEYPAGATNRIAPAGSAGVPSLIGEAPVACVEMRTRTLDAVLRERCPQLARIDLLDVDCEGADLEVLRGLDFGRWRPRVVLVEAHGEAGSAAIGSWLAGRGYRSAARLPASEVFIERAPG